jgi:raffinose/stachyose/melibiose transport system permease protein
VRVASVLARGSLHAVLIVVAAIAIGPLLLLFFAALKTNTQITIDPLVLPRDWLFENFAEAWETAHLGTFVVNSILVTVPTLAIVLVSSSLAGYAFGVIPSRTLRLLFPVFLLGLMVPTISIAIPIYYTMRDLGMLSTLHGLVLAESAQALPIAVFVMRAAFRDLPPELRDAGLVDGCGELGAYRHILLPLTRPAAAAVATLVFLSAWNSFLLPLLLLNDESLRTLPLGLSYLQGRYVTDVALLAAATVLTLVPTVLVYVVLQRQFMRGIVEGSAK